MSLIFTLIFPLPHIPASGILWGGTQRICSFYSYSSFLVWCLDALNSSYKPSFLVSYRVWTHQFLLVPKKFWLWLLFFFNAKISLLQILLWQIFPQASFFIFIARIWPCMLLLFHPCCYGFQVLGDVFRILYFVSVMVLNLLLHSRDKVLNWPCHMPDG